MRRVYYFDNNATTRPALEVIEAMLPFLTERWGNPSSAYRFGRDLAREVTAAREKVAALIGAEPDEIVFTSGGTESINTAIHSALAAQPQKRHVITTAVEHAATLNFCAALSQRGYDVTLLPVGPDGLLDLGLLEKAIRADTAMVSVMWANNETGVLFPVEEIGAICRRRGVIFHTDAVQVAGKLRIDVKAVQPDFLSLSAHKVHAPKGTGLLYVRRGTPHHPYIFGGRQERGHRGGTENVPGIVAFGRAAELAMARLDEQATRVRALRDHLEETILANIPHTVRNGAREPRLPNTTNIAFDFVEAEAVLLLLDEVGICASSGSACTAGSLDPSHVLTAMGLSSMRARGSIRFSLSVETTAEEVDYLLDHLPRIIARLREISPLGPTHSDDPGDEARSTRIRHEGEMAAVAGA